MPNLKLLTDLMAALRHSDSGCPWAIRQTSQSIARYTLEETYELLHAIEANDSENIKEELGDLLFHVVFHSQIAEENGLFNIDDVIREIVNKMTRRHPHVFEESRSNRITDEELDAQWQHTKSMDKTHPTRVLDEVGQKLPAMMRSQLLQNAAAEYHFDWPDAAPVLDKIEEETEELREALAQGDINHIRSEMGDVLFACVNLARHVNVDAESALRQTNEKFIRRFDYVVHQMQQAGIDFSPQQLEQMELFWQQSKEVTG
jgi:ATP diphosphatase